MSYHTGDITTLAAIWTDGDGVATDPAAVFCEYKDPSGIVTTLAYPADAALVRDGAGQYHVDIDDDEAGLWQYRFYSTGGGQAASRVKAFIVLMPTFM